METVISFTTEEISHEERLYIGKILYGCLSSVDAIAESDCLC